MKISYKDVEHCCNEMHYVAQNIKESLDEIKYMCIKMQEEETWSGTAAEFYKENIEKLISCFDEIFTELENSVLFVAKCSDGYQSIDNGILKEICTNLKITEASMSSSAIYKGV